MQTKTLHYFNPGHENAVLNRTPSYTPPTAIVEIMRELSSLPAWYADAEDYTLVDESFDNSYHEKLAKQGLRLSKLIKNKRLRELNKVKVCMWGISPRDIRYFENINKQYDIELKLPRWNDKFIYNNSRYYARDVLRFLIENSDQFNRVTIPLFFTDIQSIEEYQQKRLTKLLAKSPFSSSGRGLLWIPSTGITRPERQILQGMLNKQKSLSLEPVYDKVIDFAMEFMSDGNGEVKFEGYSLFSTNNKGSYTGNILNSQDKIEEKLTYYIDIDLLSLVKVKLIEIFSKDCGSEYQGCIGVDMMIYLEDNSYKLHPCVEINMRYNMGYLSLKLYEKYISPKAKGIFHIEYGKSGTIYDKHMAMLENQPAKIENGRITSGYLSLCPVNKEHKYRAYILIE